MRCDQLPNMRHGWQPLEPAAMSTIADCSMMVSAELCVKPTRIDCSGMVESSFLGFPVLALLVFSSAGSFPEDLCPSIPADLHNVK